MQRAAGTIEVKVAAGEVLRLRDARGCGVRLQSGRMWLTQENDSRDFMLTAGERYRIEHDGLTLLEAFRESWLTIAPPHGAGRAGSNRPTWAWGAATA